MLRVVHEDPHFVVVEKDGGMLSVPGRGPDKQDCVTGRVRDMYPGCVDQPSVHRLDLETSGLMVVARTAFAQRNLSIQFQNRETRKEYVALLDGEIEDEAGTIELAFRLDVDNRPLQIYDAVHGKIGITHWKRVAVVDGVSRVSFTPVTGRTHQLRVHAAHERGLGTPIVGDSLYGRGVGPNELKLHACHLAFRHPETGEYRSFHSAPPF